MQITGFVVCCQCVAKTVVAGVCVVCVHQWLLCVCKCVDVYVCVCVCVRVHVLRLVLVRAGGVAYGCRVGWALLCTPGVKWTV